jgi:DNA-binding transcriptional LysR family regulator
MESTADLNLLVALDALLDERSVGRAARRLNTSAPAVSRVLAKLRRKFDDPLLVRAGRVMVPTPRALALHPDVHRLVVDAQAVFAPPRAVDPATLTNVFSLQFGDIVVSSIGDRLLRGIHAEAPRVVLRFVAESHEDSHSLRDGGVDLELGQIRRTEPETHIEPALDESLVGVVRRDHRLLRGRVTAKRFAAAEHLVVSRRGILRGPVDDRLAELGLQRQIVACTANPTSGLHLIKNSDLVGIVGARMNRDLVESLGLATFTIPLKLPALQLSLAWHPRHHNDGAHQWLRAHVRHVLRGVAAAG